ncbi:MAG: hypothetical protein IPF76_12570 [Sphingopyxis sp.]|nr:hypothetical protein [Sphingopyxis sp.]
MAFDQTALDRCQRLLETLGVFSQPVGDRYFLPLAGYHFQALRESPQLPVMPPGRSGPAAPHRNGDQRKGGEIFGPDMHQACAGDKNRCQRQAAQ